MDFQDATDRLAESGCLTLGRIAEELGITLNSLSRMRTGGKGSKNQLNPPAGWPAVLARLAREEVEQSRGRLRDLERLAAELARASDGR